MAFEPVELRTDRLLLRPFRPHDLDDVLAYEASEAMRRHANPLEPSPYTLEDAERFLDGVVAFSWENGGQWAIELDGRVVGHVGLNIDSRRQVGELGYSIGEAFWSRGLATEAVRAVVEYAFSVRGLPKVWAETRAANAGSWRVMEKVGMAREGVLRSHTFARDGTRADLVRYGLLRGEWEARAE